MNGKKGQWKRKKNEWRKLSFFSPEKKMNGESSLS